MSRSKFFKVLQVTLVMVILLSITAGSQPAQAEPQAEEYVFRRSWGGEGDQLDGWGIAVSGDKMFVTSMRLARVTVVTKNSEFYIWGKDTTGESWLFYQPSGVAFDNEGFVYITDFGIHEILKFTPDGTYISSWGSFGSDDGKFYGPAGIAIRGGFVYIADERNHRVQKFTLDGTFVTKWGEYGTAAGQFKYPNGVTVDQLGYVYVIDTFNHRVQKFDSQGNYILQWGSYGADPGQFSFPFDIASDSDGNIYVADSHNQRIQKFTSDGSYVAQWQHGCTGIATDVSGNVYASSSGVTVFDQSGNFIRRWGYESRPDGYFYWPDSIFVDSNEKIYVGGSEDRTQIFNKDGLYIGKWTDNMEQPSGFAEDSAGNIYVLNSQNGTVVQLTATGGVLNIWGSEGSGDGQFDWPSGIAIDTLDNIYIVDTYNHRVQKFTAQGTYLMQWGAQGDAPGEFDTPYGIATDKQDNVYVADTYNGRIQKFSSNGALLYTWDHNGGSPRDLAIDNNQIVYVIDGSGQIVQYSSDGDYLASYDADYGTDSGEFIDPTGIAINNNGDVYVIDETNMRVQMFTLGLPTLDPYSGLVLNGTFESSPALDEWTYGGSLPVSRSTHATHGSYSLLLGEVVAQDKQGQGQAWAHTTFYVPTDWENPTLTFRYNIFTNETVDYSDFFVAIQDGVGLNHLTTVLRDGYPSGDNAPPAGTDLGWRSAGFDLSPYKGQHIRLVFSCRNLWPDSLGIWAYVDDVRVLDADYPFPQTVFLPMTIRR